MIDFKRVSIDDKSVYEKYLFNEKERGCEFSFANLIMWGKQNLAMLHDHIVLFSQFDEKTVYPFPLGNGDKKPVIDAILEDAKERGINCHISGIRPWYRELLEELYPGEFVFHSNRGSFDYVYNIDDLADLKGRKYQSKRNHCNRFEEAYPNYRTEPICESNLEKVRKMAEEWYGRKSADNPDEDYHMEKKALERAFKHYDELGMEGLVLLDGEDVLAFTMANKMSPVTLDVNFEKAQDIQGAYAVINRDFARYIREKYPEIKYLDREEDLGIEGLRKAKESYKPDHLTEKCWATLKEE